MVAFRNLGAGTRRAANLAALELYRDQGIWAPDRPVMLLIEEPETGLHPAAQRRVAVALRDLPSFGVQVVISTHSSIFINAVGTASVRIVARRPAGMTNATDEHTVYAPVDLAAAVRELGALPSDLLLARRFVVVEGESDVGILTTWARRLGADVRSYGVQLVPSQGQGNAAVVARFLDLAYEGADFRVLLDNGPDTDKTRRTLEARYKERIKVALWTVTEIEAFFHPNAIVRWFAKRLDLDAQRERNIHDVLASGVRKKTLRGLVQTLLLREYDVVNDGVGIAGLMTEAEIPIEVRNQIYDLVGD